MNKYIIILFLIILIILLFNFINNIIIIKIENFDNNKIPKIIWQTYKTKDLPKDAYDAHKTWVDKNPDWKINLYDDNDIENHIKTYWNKDMLNFYKALPIGVMKADLWRYLIIEKNGGVYTDIDSICILPINDWENVNSEPDMLLIGLENDQDFCQWTFMSTPNHPCMTFVCKYILDNWKKNGIDTSNGHFVHKTTGPSIWREAISEYLGYSGLKSGEIFDLYNKSDKEKINNKGVYILSKDYFENIYSKNLYGSQNFNDGYIKWIEQTNIK
jgi:mannosyltransferase OCH1-like enzyme